MNCHSIALALGTGMAALGLVSTSSTAAPFGLKSTAADQSIIVALGFGHRGFSHHGFGHHGFLGHHHHHLRFGFLPYYSCYPYCGYHNHHRHHRWWRHHHHHHR